MVYNPCHLFLEALIDALKYSGFKFYVRQYYYRGNKDSDKGYLLSHYRTREEAQRHFDTIAHDPSRYIYDVEVEEDLKKLKIAASQPPGYKIFTSLFAFEKWSVPEEIRDKLEYYIRHRTSFKSGRKEIQTKPIMLLGEVYLEIKQGKEIIKVSLFEIENV